MLTKEFVEEMKAKLLEEQARLTAEVKQSPERTDMGDEEDENASELNVDEANHVLSEIAQTDLGKIAVALQKIEDGTYGTDADGNEIGEARLRALPWAEKAI